MVALYYKTMVFNSPISWLISDNIIVVVILVVIILVKQAIFETSVVFQ